MPNMNRSIRLVTLGLGALGASLLALAACSDSLHLDPTPVPPGGTGGSVGQGGAGGNAPTPCESSSDCSFPESVCDTTRRECVECLEHTDCSFRPGTVCDRGVCGCPVEGEQFCAALGQPGQAGYQPARCINHDSSQTDCGQCGNACYGNCTMGACADPWTPTSELNAPSKRFRHVAVWASELNQMIVWGGENQNGVPLQTGGIYDPATRKWTATSLVNVPSPRRLATAVWTGTRMIVWGGLGSTPLADGASFDPVTNTWEKLPDPGFPTPFVARYFHTAVWTGDAMIIWGGSDGPSSLADGAVYRPELGLWSQTTAGAPARRQHTAVWAPESGNNGKMIVFGGHDGTALLNTAAYYDSAANTWTDVGVAGITARIDHSAVWTGSQMILWGGTDGTTYFGDGARFQLPSAWSGVNVAGPSPRAGHTAVWIGGDVAQMIVWGGTPGSSIFYNNGGIYSPGNDAWNLEMPTAPAGRAYHTAVVTGNNQMIIWGGQIAGDLTNTGAVFDAAAAP